MNTILAMDKTDVLKKAKEFNEQFAFIQKSGPLDDLLVTIKGPQTLAFGKVLDVQVLPNLSSKSILKKSDEYEKEYQKAVQKAKDSPKPKPEPELEPEQAVATSGYRLAKKAGDEKAEDGKKEAMAAAAAEQEAIATALAISSAIAVAT